MKYSIEYDHRGHYDIVAPILCSDSHTRTHRPKLARALAQDLRIKHTFDYGDHGHRDIDYRFHESTTSNEIVNVYFSVGDNNPKRIEDAIEMATKLFQAELGELVRLDARLSVLAKAKSEG
jgi:hypothetical protein